MIHTYIPYAPKEQGNNLGWAYNNFMEIIPKGDWACFLDHDATFTTRYWYYQLEEVIRRYPDIGLFTSLTNRIGQQKQVVGGVDRESHDIAYHRKIGSELYNKHYDTVFDFNNPSNLLSGVVILISKDTWKKVGGFIDGFLGVDNDIHSKCLSNNIKVGLMGGVYVYHWYRGDKDNSHLKFTK
jgi:GT2 family glycosyltransferase